MFLSIDRVFETRDWISTVTEAPARLSLVSRRLIAGADIKDFGSQQAAPT